MINRSRALFAAAVVVAVFIIWRSARCREWGPCATTATVAAFDGNRYRVHARHDDHARAAGLLARVHARMLGLVRAAVARHGGGADWRGAAARRLKARYEASDLVESSPLNPEGDTAFVRGKVVEFALCLRAGDAGSFHDINTIMFVAIHEAAHMAVDTYGHDAMFWRTNRLLLRIAASEHLCAPVDYARNPVRYCGAWVKHNPYYDD